MAVDRTLYLEVTALCGAAWPWWSAAVEEVDRRMAQDSAHDWAHLARVWVTARRLWEAEHGAPPAGRSWRVLAAAALFHDVVNVPKNSPHRSEASTRAGGLARDWLVAHAGFLEDEADEVFWAIRSHSYASGYRAESAVGEVLSDADRLDALGAVGLARTFAVGGALGRALAHPLDPLAQRRAPDDAVWSVDHLFIKLFSLKELLYTEAARVEAREREGVMRVFLEALAREVTLGEQP